MAVIMPAAGLLYDKIGPRWPAVIGLALVALGTYLLTDVNLESSTSHVIWVLILRASVGRSCRRAARPPA